jgi:predicted RND superfamily exporter protein
VSQNPGLRQTLGPALIDRLYQLRWLAMFLALALTGLAGWAAKDIGVDNSVEIWFLEDDPTLVAYHEFQETYGNDEVVVIALSDPETMLDARGYARLREAGDRALAVQGIAEVTSLTTVLDVRADGFDIEIEPLIPQEVPDHQALREHVLDDPVLVHTLISEDGKTALVLARMEAMGDIDARRDGILAELELALGDIPHRSAGIGVIYAALNQLATVDSAVFIGASYGLIVLLLLLLYRRILPVIVTFAIVGVGAAWLMGAYGAAGRDINMVTMVLPTLVTIIGVSDCVHILGHAAAEARKHPEMPRRERVAKAVGFMFWPCLFNTLTTAMGFLALTTAPMAVVRDLGMFAAIGLFAAFVAAIVGCTFALQWSGAEPRDSDRGWLARGVSWLSEMGLRRPGAVLAGTGLMTLVCAIGAARLEVDTYSIDFLYDDHPVKQDSAAIEEAFGYTMPLEIVVRTEDPLDPEVLAAVRAWTDAATEHPDIDWGRSLVDVVERLNMVLTDGEEANRVVPASAAAVEQGLLLYSGDGGDDLERWRTDDSLRVTFGMRMMSARGMESTLEDVLAVAEMPEGVTLVPSGYLPLYVRMMDYIVVSQLRSFGLAFVIVFGLLALLFRSHRVAALAVPANLLPILFVLGVMGVAGIRLDVATVTIAAIVLGLVVDDTVQFLYRFRAELAESPDDHEAAVRRTIDGIGRTLAITTIVLALGFSVLGLAEVKSVAYFGVLISLSLVFALLCDVLVLPAIIVLVKPKL